ncbi:hypothetical protein, partial [Actinomadura rayongensis]|uniref:hypothetical protein n=1 Tax=Actinomadura rayongensis TaxID=1429076 RepID=UPI0035E89D23
AARPAARTAPRARPAAEPRPEPRTEPRTDARTEARTDARVEPRVERAARPARGSAPRAPYFLRTAALLGGALLSHLLLNTVLAEDAFTLTRLQRDNKILAQQKQGLEEEIAREESPESLRKKAEQLGMRQPDTLAWLDADTGRPIGGSMRPVPIASGAAAGTAVALARLGAVVTGDGVPTAPGGAETP